jgi:hypothetical protein
MAAITLARFYPSSPRQPARAFFCGTAPGSQPPRLGNVVRMHQRERNDHHRENLAMSRQTRKDRHWRERQA